MAKNDAKTRALKGLVIAMGALIVIGLTIVVVTIAMRVSDPKPPSGTDRQTAGADGEASMTPGPTLPARGLAPFGALHLGLADSCRIAGVVGGAADSAGTLIVRLDGPAKDGCDQLVVVDTAQGRVLGRIKPGSPDSSESFDSPGNADSGEDTQ